jgi:dGTPase
VLRAFNYERVYTRPEALAQSAAVVAVLRSLVEHYLQQTDRLPADFRPDGGATAEDAVRAAVTYVGGMTDRFAFRTAIRELGWDPSRLPRGIDVPRQG